MARSAFVVFESSACDDVAEGLTDTGDVLVGKLIVKSAEYSGGEGYFTVRRCGLLLRGRGVNRTRGG